MPSRRGEYAHRDASAFFTEMGLFAPTESRRVVYKPTAIKMNLIQYRDNCYK